MSEEFKIILIFFIGIISTYLGAFVVGGISTFSILLMSMMGLSPQLSAITFKLGKIGSSLGIIGQAHKASLIRKEYILGLGVAAFTGGAIGSFFIVTIPDFYIYSLAVLSLSVVLVTEILSKRGQSHTQLSRSVVSKLRKDTGYIIEFFATIMANISPVATGTYFYFIRTFFFRLSPLESKALGSITTIPWFLGTTIGVFLGGEYSLPYATSLGVGMFIGSYFGTKHTIQLGNQKLKKIIQTFFFFSAFYFLYLAYNSWSNF